jgi:hypothetical protein
VGEPQQRLAERLFRHRVSLVTTSRGQPTLQMFMA